MPLIEDLLNAQGGGAAASLSNKFGLEEDQVRSAMQALVPAIAGGLQRNTREEGGIESLLGALGQGSHDRYLDDPDMALQPDGINDGNAILGHIFGSKDVSREVASRAATTSGVDSNVLKQMLPVVASMAMGALSKRAGGGTPFEGGGLGDLVGDALGGLLGGGGAANALTSMLDSDGDGSIIDDIVGGLFKR